MNSDAVRWCACCSEFTQSYEQFSLNPDRPQLGCLVLGDQLCDTMRKVLNNSYRRPIQQALAPAQPGLADLGLVLCWRRYLTAASDDQEVEAGINEAAETMTLCKLCLHHLQKAKARPPRSLANRLQYLAVPKVYYGATDIELTVSGCGRRCVKVFHLET